MVAFNAEELVESMDGISGSISKQWIGLILLPAVSSIAGLSFPRRPLLDTHCVDRMCDRHECVCEGSTWFKHQRCS